MVWSNNILQVKKKSVNLDLCAFIWVQDVKKDKKLSIYLLYEESKFCHVC